MYCIHCGNPIPENSKFCSQCGKEQIISKVETKTEVVTQEVTPNNTLSSFKNTISRTALIWYCIWVVLHLGLLLIGSDGIFDSSNMRGMDDFFPFNYKSDVEDYDITEFLVYTLFPLLIMFIAYLVKTNKPTNDPSQVGSMHFVDKNVHEGEGSNIDMTNNHTENNSEHFHSSLTQTEQEEKNRRDNITFILIFFSIPIVILIIVAITQD